MSAMATSPADHLEGLLLKIAFAADDVKLSAVLQKALPQILGFLHAPDSKTQTKVLEVLSHVNKRVKEQVSIQLPLQDLVTVYQSSASPLQSNMALLYVQMAYDRALPEQKLATVEPLLRGIASKPGSQRDTLCRLAVQGLEPLSRPAGPWSGPSSQQHCKAQLLFLNSDKDRQVFLDFALKLLLYFPKPAAPVLSAAPGVRNELLEAQLALQARNRLAGDATQVIAQPQGENGAYCPAGLSADDVRRVEGNQQLDINVLTNRKLAVLHLTSIAGIEPEEMLLHYLVSACDPKEQVSRLGEELLRKRCAVDNIRPSVDLENVDVIRKAMLLFHGTVNKAAPQASKVTPASPAVRLRLMNLFTRSITAANMFPLTLATVCECIYGTTSSVRLRQTGMEFSVWVFKHAQQQQLLPMGPIVLKSLVRLLDEEPPSSTSSPLQQSIQGFAYSAIAQLATRMPSLVLTQDDIAGRFFTALQIEPPSVVSTVKEVMPMMAKAYQGCSADLSVQLEAHLLRNMDARQSECRLAAVQWARRIFPFSNAGARYVCMLGTGDVKQEIVDEATRGLTPEASALGDGDVEWPTPQSVLQYVCMRRSKLKQPAVAAEALLLQPKAFMTMINFVEQCQTNSGMQLDAEATSQYLNVLEHALVGDTSTDLARMALKSILTAAKRHQDVVVTRYASQLSWLQGFLGHLNSEVRILAAQVMALSCQAMDASSCKKLLEQMTATAAASNSSAAVKSKALEEREGAVAGMAYVTAQAMTGSPDIDKEVLAASSATLLSILDDAEAPALVSGSLRGLGLMGVRGPVPLPQEQSMEQLVKRLCGFLEDEKYLIPALQALGLLAVGNVADSRCMQLLTEAVLKLAAGKQKDDVLFVAGETLALAFGGVGLAPSGILYMHYHGVSSWFAERICRTAPQQADAQAEASDSADVVMEDIIHMEATTGNSDAESSPASSLQGEVLSQILDDLMVSSKTEARLAGSVWLLSLITFCKRQGVLTRKLLDIQDAFFSLLGDKSSAIQDVSTKGLSGVFSLAGSDSTRQKQLLEVFVASLQGGSKRRRINIGGSTGSSTGGSVAKESDASYLVYKELSSLANSVGHPSLVYWLMDVANENSSYFAGARVAAFRFQSVSTAAKDHLAPYVATMLPQLYRYQSDPNPRVQDAMKQLWRQLVTDPRAAIDHNYDAIVKQVLSDMGSRSTRTREAATAALGDLLQGQRWDKLGAHLNDMWNMSFRSLDDLSESVRTVALQTFKTLRNVSLRLSDAAQSPAGEASEALKLVLGVLMQQGVSNAASEIQAVSVDTLTKLCSAAAPTQLVHHLPSLIPVMLECLSGLEDSRLNYIEQHAERLGLDSGRLEGARVSAARSSPMWHTLDVALRALAAAEDDGKVMGQVVQKLASLVKSGVGVNTRSGTARFIANMATRVPQQVKPHSALLLKALMSGSTSERSSAVLKAMSSAVAAVAHLIPEARLEKLSLQIQELAGSGDGSDVTSRRLSSLLCKELARSAADVFASQAAVLLPVAWLGRSDEDTEVAANFSSAWEEGTTSSSAALRVYMPDISKQIVDGLNASRWERKKAAAKSLVAAIKESAEAVDPVAPQLLEALLKELPGRLWEGKQVMLEALAAMTQVPSAVSTIEHERAIIAALCEAAGKRKDAYRQGAVSALKSALEQCPNDNYSTIAVVLSSEIAKHDTTITTTVIGIGNGGGDEDEGVQKPLPLKDLISCLTAALKHLSTSSVTIALTTAQPAILTALRADQPWAARSAAAVAAAQLLQQLQQLQAGTNEGTAACATTFSAPLCKCLEELRYSTLRTNALQALQLVCQILHSCRPDGTASKTLCGITDELKRLVGRENSIVVKASAVKLLDITTCNGTVDAPS